MDLNELRDEVMRNAVAETVVRLRSAGIDIDEDHDPAELTNLLEAVEAFENAVRAHGGDLMIDEPPIGGELRPDNPNFVLPVLRADETLRRYTMRVREAARAIR